MLLLRHASAGAPLPFRLLDRERALDERGRNERDLLRHTLEDYVLERVVTSPHVRCVETVRSLAVARGLALELRDELAPDAARESTLALLEELPTAALVCTHREVIERLFDGEVECEKGGAWLLDRVRGRWSPIRYHPPRSSVRAGRAVTAVG
jgi:8-oxo-dGTP diphosphatase